MQVPSYFSCMQSASTSQAIHMGIDQRAIRPSKRKGRLPARVACFICRECGRCAVGAIRCTLRHNANGVHLDVLSVRAAMFGTRSC